jgi:hypothetical protein
MTVKFFIIRGMYRVALRRFQSTVTYNRKGEQPNVAPKIVKQISKTSQGVTVITSDNFGPASSVAIFLSQGSSSDSAATPGVAHIFKRSVLRVCFILYRMLKATRSLVLY